MRIDAIWNRWMEIVAALVVGMRERWRMRRAISIAFKDGRLVVRDGAAPGASAELPAPAALAATARRHFVELELPADEIVMQRIKVPARAREFLPGIVHNQIERLSPWPADQVLYGFDAEPTPEDPENLNARVLIAARATVEAARDRLAALGMSADRIAAREQGAVAAPPITLWSRYENGSGQALDHVRRMIGAAVLAVFGLSFALSAWLLISAAATRADADEVAARSATLQRQLQGGRAAVASASADPAERAWVLKETAPSGVMVLETLSRALPDHAYVTELSLQKTTMRVVGLTEDAASLVAPLEGSGRFAEVHFFAPTTRGPDGRLFWFHIEARVVPQIEGSEH
jgi:general secretion pathway protein L